MKHDRRTHGARPESAKGAISVHPRGFGFVRLEDGSEIFIPAQRLNSALPGDSVLVKLRPGKTWRKNREGTVVKILERKIIKFAGFYNGGYVVPRDEKILHWFLVPRDHARGASAGDIVIARITAYPTEAAQGSAEILEVLGRELTPQLESKLILSQYGFSEEFPPAALNELRQVPDHVRGEDRSGRKDLTGLALVTVDPEDARDFDDAVAVEKTAGGFKLWVAIADVSAYVRGGTELDREAYARSTSVYFPDRAIPMLPEAISSGISSLKPEEDRLCMVAEMVFDHKGNMGRRDFYPAVMRSKFRMTYRGLQHFLDADDPEITRQYEAIGPNLFEMKELAEILAERRSRRGGLDFEIAEPKVKLDERGEPADVFAYPRLFAHRLIEEFMLAANQAVAEFLAAKKLAFPYRIHEQPEMEKIAELNLFLAGLGHPLLRKGQTPEQLHPRDFQKLFDSVAGLPIAGLVSYLTLRSMMQAKYELENKGHFGLALEHYCHFTSPIRRYPDLIVHRVLKQALGFLPGAPAAAPESLAAACEHCSLRERASTSAERDMVKLYQARLLAGHLGEQFSGVVSGLTEFGVFVELLKPMAEGLIPAPDLTGYALNEKLHTAYVKFPRLELHLGDQVLVEVVSVNLERREINFRLIGVLASAFSRPASSLGRDRPEPTRRPEKGRRPQREKRRSRT